MTPDRKAILKDAHRRYRRRLSVPGLIISWAEALRRAWAAWRHRVMEIMHRMIAVPSRSTNKTQKR